MKKKILALGLSLIMIATMFAGCGNSKISGRDVVPDLTVNEKESTPIELEYDEEGYALVAENEKFELYLMEDGEAIKVVDLTTGKVWCSSATSFNTTTDDAVAEPIEPENYDSDKVPTYKISNVGATQSIFALSYFVKSSTGNSSANNYFSDDYPYSVEIEGIENGVRVYYDIYDYEMKFAMDFSLSEKGLVVEIPYECIEEGEEYAIVSITPIPYFADAIDSNDGFYFYPDGSGAIMEFGDSAHNTEDALKLNVYGDIMKYKNTLDVLAEAEPEIMLPVYGASINDNGFLAVIEDGASYATITVDPAKNQKNDAANIIYTTFVYRRSFLDPRDQNNEARNYDSNLIQGERKIEYIFLEEGKTSYSDMAVAYRNYLVNECGVEDLKNDEKIALSLDLFMGINEEGTFVDSYKNVTTFEQSETILKELVELGVDNIQLQLKGWTTNGYFTEPEMFPVNKAAGGDKGLKNLLSYTKDKNIQVTLEANFIEAAAEAGGYSQRNDVVYLGNKTLANSNDIYILSPRKSRLVFDEFLKDSEEFGISGVSLYSMGQYVPYNYNQSDYVLQDQTIAIWEGIMDTANEKNMYVAVQGGNSYVLGKADKITDLTYEDSGYLLTTKDVPFYQIAVHGLTEYTGKAANISSDLTYEKLKWIELGYNPYFELTYSGSEDLMYTDYALLFSSEYQNWLDDCEAIYTEMNENLAEVSNSYIVNHEEIQPNVFKVTYENGKAVYVNYNEELAIVNGIHIAARDYVVK